MQLFVLGCLYDEHSVVNTNCKVAHVFKLSSTKQNYTWDHGTQKSFLRCCDTHSVSTVPVNWFCKTCSWKRSHKPDLQSFSKLSEEWKSTRNQLCRPLRSLKRLELVLYQGQNSLHGPMGPIQNTGDNYTPCERGFCFKAQPLSTLSAATRVRHMGNCQ
jgi:hypothetical protein